MAAQRMLLPDGRWHFQHGPMDIVIGADGDAVAVEAAHAQAWARFATLLNELVAELPLLRQPVKAGPCPVRGVVARRMWQACEPFRAGFITPMAAVAGAVAQELVICYQRDGVQRAWINNGGDIALHLSPGASVRIGLYADMARLRPRDVVAGITTDGQFDVAYALPVRGVATSGWRGRSFSLGIADAVTVLAATAAQADAAASMIANAVDIADARIVRRPACEIKDNSDLGEIPVTVDVPPLAAAQVRQALAAGLARARELQAAGLVHAAFLVCQGQAASAAAVAGDAAAPPVGLRAIGSGVDEVGSVFA